VLVSVTGWALLATLAVSVPNLSVAGATVSLAIGVGDADDVVVPVVPVSVADGVGDADFVGVPEGDCEGVGVTSGWSKQSTRLFPESAMKRSPEEFRSRKINAQNPSHLGSKIHVRSAGNSSIRFASIGVVSVNWWKSN
jgi:hypothetical protein